MRSPWPNSHNSPAYQFNRGLPTGSASSQLSQWQRLNAGLSGPLAFEHDFQPWTTLPLCMMQPLPPSPMTFMRMGHLLLRLLMFSAS